MAWRARPKHSLPEGGLKTMVTSTWQANGLSHHVSGRPFSSVRAWRGSQSVVHMTGSEKLLRNRSLVSPIEKGTWLLHQYSLQLAISVAASQWWSVMTIPL